MFVCLGWYDMYEVVELPADPEGDDSYRFFVWWVRLVKRRSKGVVQGTRDGGGATRHQPAAYGAFVVDLYVPTSTLVTYLPACLPPLTPDWFIDGALSIYLLRSRSSFSRDCAEQLRHVVALKPESVYFSW